MPPAPGPNAAPRMPAVTQTRAARGRATRRLGEEIESGDDDERCPDRLDAARGNEHLERPCKPAGKRRGREDESAGEERWAWPAPGYKSGRYGDEREHEVERGENPGNRRDPHVETPEDLGKRKRDDRGVREREPDGETEQPGAHDESR